MTIADMAIADCARPRVRPDHALAHNTSALLPSQEFDAEDDSWESHLNAEIIEEFEESELLKAKRAAKHAAKAPKVPPVPFTRELADAESDEVRRAAARPAAPPPLDAPPAKPSPAVYDLPGE